MTIQIAFPDKKNLSETLQKYSSEKNYKKKLVQVCFDEFGCEKAFTYTMTSKKNNQWQCWKCEQCEAFMQYKFQQQSEYFLLASSSNEHQHKISHFQNFDQQKLRNKIGQRKCFIFPNQTVPIKEFQTEDSLLKTYNAAWQINYQGLASCHIVHHISNKREIVLQCKYKDICLFQQYCAWKIIYKYDQISRKWLLSNKNNQHQHYFNIPKRNYSKDQTNVMASQVTHKLIQLQQINATHTCQQDNVDKSYVHRLIEGYNQVFKQPKKPLYQALNMLLKALRKQHMQIRYKHLNQLINRQSYSASEEDILVISSKLMKFMSKSYGKVVQLKRQKIHQQPMFKQGKTCGQGKEKQKREDVFQILTFYGFSYGYRLVIYGFGIIRNIAVQKILKVFDKMKNNYLNLLETLIIEQKDQLLVKSFSLYPESKKSFHIDIRMHPQNQKLQAFMFDGSKTKLEVQIQKYMLISQNQLDEQYILAHSQFPQYREQFVGLDFNLQSLQVDQKILKMTQGTSNLASFQFQLHRLIDSSNQINQGWFRTPKQHLPYQNLFQGRDDIHKSRLMMGKIPFSKLIQQILLIPSVNVLHHETSFYIVETPQQQYPYLISKSSNNSTKSAKTGNCINLLSKWVCECGYSIKSGIPCCHQLKIMGIENINYYEGINQFWIIDQAIINLQPNPEKANNPFQSKRKRRLGRRKLIA